MSKTNHRVNKDRTEKLQEAKAHAQRRGFNTKAKQLAEYYDPSDPDLLYDEVEDDEPFETYTKMRRRTK
jgi:hypothetical protein